MSVAIAPPAPETLSAPEAIVEALLGTPLIERLREHFIAMADAITREQVTIAEIPAPPFREAARARFLAERLRAAGLPLVRQDAEGNVCGWLPGADPTRPPIVVAAHLDTVFPPETDVRVSARGARLYAPGIADNACGLAGLLALARAFVLHDARPAGPFCFVGTVGEEGEGNLRGVRALVANLPQIRFFIALDGPGLERVTCRAIGSRRFRVTFGGLGGHSWANFGAANPIHALGEFIYLLRRLPLRSGATCTVATVGGGGVINAIPTEARAELDCRACANADLDHLENAVRLAVVQAQQAEMQAATQRSRLAATVQRLGDRPAGEMPRAAALVRCAVAATRACGQRPTLDSGSTDANVPMALGIPAIAIGAGGEYGGCHTLEEWYDPAGRPQSLTRAALLLLALDRLPVEAPEQG